MPNRAVPEPAEAASFDELWDAADRVPGWLTREQGQLLFDCASSLPPGSTMLEIGSHQGRSALVLGGVARRRGSTLVAVDPFVEGPLFGGPSTRDKFLHNIAEQRLEETVELVEDYSTALRPGWDRRIDLLYIDGKHDYWTVSDDLRWATYLPAGGQLLLHDSFSSIGVTLGVLLRVLPGRELRYLRRAGSLALFERRPPTRADRMAILAQLPWWLRNLAIKVLLRLRLRTLASRFGHDSPYDPY